MDQKELRRIRDDLEDTFSKFRKYETVEFYVQNEMKKYLLSSFYTNEKCEAIFKKAIKEVESDVQSKYTSIANQLNQYLDELKETAESVLSPSEYSKNDFKNLAIGGGAGLAAAAIFGGPVGWLVILGTGVAALVNSSQKKNELIIKIVEYAEKINNEAINKLRPILNKLIVPESKLLEIKSSKVEKNFVEEIKLSKEQKEIKNFLEKRGIEYLVHFTKLKNLDSIRKYGIVSPSEAKRLGIKIETNNDEEKNAHRPDRFMKSDSHDYISLTITNMNEKVFWAFYTRPENKREKWAIIYLDASLLWKEIDRDRIYCDTNATATNVTCGKQIKDLEHLFIRDENDFESIFTNDNQPTNIQAEILFEKSIDFEKYYKKVEFKN